MCSVGNWNLSYESVTSREVRQALKDLKHIDPEFWKEISQTDDGPEPEGEEIDEADNGCCEERGDDSMIPTEVLIEHICNGSGSVGLKTCEGNLVASGMADQITSDSHEEMSAEKTIESSEINDDEPVVQEMVEELGVGKRKRIPNRLYCKEVGFWKH